MWRYSRPTPSLAAFERRLGRCCRDRIRRGSGAAAWASSMIRPRRWVAVTSIRELGGNVGQKLPQPLRDGFGDTPMDAEVDGFRRRGLEGGAAERGGVRADDEADLDGGGTGVWARSFRDVEDVDPVSRYDGGVVEEAPGAVVAMLIELRCAEEPV